MRRVAIDFPDRWTSMVDTTKSLGGRAAIAGGCFRDIAHGKVLKDIDLFTDTPKIVGQTLHALGYESTYTGEDLPDSGSESIVMDVTNWVTAKNPELPPVQVIEVVEWTDPMQSIPEMRKRFIHQTFLEYVVNSFDLAFGQVGTDDGINVYATPECLADWDDNQITVIVDEGCRTVDRLSRLRSRYCSWTCRDTDGVMLSISPKGTLVELSWPV
jgi:hypothetical protein